MILSLNILINVVNLNKSVLLFTILARNFSYIRKMKELCRSTKKWQHYFDIVTAKKLVKKIAYVLMEFEHCIILEFQ